MNSNLENIKKYVGSCCGNSFLIIDCRDVYIAKEDKANFAQNNIHKYEVDSALFIENTEGHDIYIDIFEQDGSESGSCGNGMLLVSYILGMQSGTIKMRDSVATVGSDTEKQSISIDVKYLSISKISDTENLYVKIGEPHIIYLVDDLGKFNLNEAGKSLQKEYLDGVNVDGIQKIDDTHFLIKTFERGVLRETKSCGTGSLSSYVAISFFSNKLYTTSIELKSSGGIHWVSEINGSLKLETSKKSFLFKITN